MWWSKFNYVLTSAMDCGTVLAVLFIFFTLQFPKGGFNINWWGNLVYTESACFGSSGSRSPWRRPSPSGHLTLS